MYENLAHSKVKFLDGMQQQAFGRPDGKKLFMEKTNYSDKQNMYPVLKDQEAENLLRRRMADDYGAKHDIEYIPPPVSKIFDHKSTFVHNAIANKNKVNVEHFKNIFNKKTFSEEKR